MTDLEIQEQAEKASIGSEHEIGFYNGFIQGAKWMQEQDEWISCEDRLPNNDKEYIISNNLGNMFLAQYWEGNWIFDDYTFHNITHFMPLPSPPKTK